MDAAEEQTLRGGVIWMLVPDETTTGDGKFTAYLVPTDQNLARFMICDPRLYTKLGWIVAKDERNVGAVDRYQVLPKGTIFYPELLTFKGISPTGPHAQAERKSHRERWFHAALDATDEADLVFLDPDNGLEVGISRSAAKGPKFLDELESFVTRGQSLVVDQHIGKDAPAGDQVRRRLANVRCRFAGIADTFALVYRGPTLRAFIVISKHAPTLRRRAELLLQGNWNQHFEMIESDRNPRPMSLEEGVKTSQTFNQDHG